MWRRFALRLQTLSARYGEQTAPVCCGVCKPCVTTAATGLVVAAAGSTIATVTGRRSTAGEHGPRTDEDHAD